MGISKLGSVIKFIPAPVIVGFTTGIGVIIFVSEWKDFFGLKVHIPLDLSFYLKLMAFTKALPQLQVATLGLASLSLFLILIAPKCLKRIPGPLVAMVIVTLVQVIFNFKDVATLGSAFGAIPQQLPSLDVPHLPISRILDLTGAAFTIALLSAIESLLSATVADTMAGTRHDSNQELIGQGLANMIAPLFGGFAATGAIARTATNISNGGNSPLAAIVHSIVLILTLLVLAPFAAYIPLCTLAAILFVVAYNMSDIPHFIYMLKKAPYYDVVVLLTTFLLTVFTDLVIAVNVGVILAMLFFIRRMNQVVRIEEETYTTLENELAAAGILSLPKELAIYTIQGPFFFGTAEKIEHALASTHNLPKKIIFRLKEVPFMDITGLGIFNRLIEKFRKEGVEIYICEANAKVAHKLEKLGLLNVIAENKIFDTLVKTLNSITAA